MRAARSAFVGVIAYLAMVVLVLGCGPKRALPGDWKFYTPYNAEAGTISFTDSTFTAKFKTLDGSLDLSGPYLVQGSTVHLEFRTVTASGTGHYTLADRDDLRDAKSFDLLVHWRDNNVVELRSTAKGPGQPDQLNFLLARNDAASGLDSGAEQVAIDWQHRPTHTDDGAAGSSGRMVTVRSGSKGSPASVAQNPPPAGQPSGTQPAPTPSEPTPTNTEQPSAPEPVDTAPQPTPEPQPSGTGSIPDPTNIPMPDPSTGTTTGG